MHLNDIKRKSFNDGYQCAVKKAKEYVEQRKSHGVNDPYMLNEIEEAYYEGMVQSENFWHPASEPPVFDEFNDNKEVIGVWKCQNLSECFGTIPYKVADYVQYKNGKWLYGDTSVPVEYWCYPPKKD